MYIFEVCDSVLATDILFVLDTSSGVGEENFNKMKQFLDKIVKSFDIDNLLTRVGIITFDIDSRLDIKLNEHNNERALLDGMRRRNPFLTLNTLKTLHFI